jgi:hypothetical protein
MARRQPPEARYAQPGLLPGRSHGRRIEDPIAHVTPPNVVCAMPTLCHNVLT